MCAWVFLALRDERLIGAGERLEDARRLCEDKMAELYEERPGEWLSIATPAAMRDGAKGWVVVAVCGPYVIRRAPVARFGEQQ